MQNSSGRRINPADRLLVNWSVYRKYRTDIRRIFHKTDTDTDVSIWNTEKCRIPTVKYWKVGSIRYFYSFSL